MSVAAAIDLRCLTEPYGSGVAMYTRRMLEAIAREPRLADIEWIGFTSGAHQHPLDVLPLPYRRRHLPIPNTILNTGIALFNVPSVERCVGPARFVWQPNPMFLAPPKQPLFVTIHDLSFLHLPEFFERHTRAWYLRWVMSWLTAAPSGTYLMAVSEYTRRDLLQYFPQWAGRIIVQPPPPPDLRPARRKPNELSLLAVGTLEPRKNYSTVIDAFRIFRRRFPEATLTIAGRVTRTWRSYVRAHPLPTGVTVAGYVDSATRNKLYAEAWCVLYPSFMEGYGLPPLEAMVAGVPVIAAATGAVPEVLGDAALFIDPYRATESLAAALESLATDDEFYNTLVTRGQNRLGVLARTYSLSPLLSLWFDHISA